MQLNINISIMVLMAVVFVFIIITYMNIIIANWIPDIVRESVLG